MNLKTKLPGYNLQEILIVLAIIGILLLIALPNLMPLIARTKSTEAKQHLNAIYNAQTMHRYMYSKYAVEFDDIDYEAPKTTTEGGRAYYRYEIVKASSTSFLARATAVDDYDGDGIFNVWEIDENGAPVQKIKD